MGYEVVGTWRQIVHWGPILALSVIGIISVVTMTCDLVWWPVTSVGGLLNMAVFMSWVLLTLYNYFKAAMLGPGFTPFGWKPADESDCQHLQFCEICQGYKPPRAHHCRKCNRCVMKMDHHCPWINTCCGHFNHGNFVWFLFFAPCGCIHAVCILIGTIYRAINYNYYYYHRREDLMIELHVATFILTMFTIGLAIGVIVAVGMLFYIQLRSILKNETGIETWIITKAQDRTLEAGEPDFVYPYNLGWRNNLRQVFTWTGRPVSNGLVWPVRHGCHQYSLTEEQLKQKAEKRERTVLYVAEKPYAGYLFPVTMGLRVCCCIPCTDEPRISIQKGDHVLVTRWRKHWLYGTKTIPEASPINGVAVAKGLARVRGWFPRQCVREVVDDNMNKKEL